MSSVLTVVHFLLKCKAQPSWAMEGSSSISQHSLHAQALGDKEAMGQGGRLHLRGNKAPQSSVDVPDEVRGDGSMLAWEVPISPWAHPCPRETWGHLEEPGLESTFFCHLTPFLLPTPLSSFD